ncbi:MAG TPA: lysophospholipid acyltransferase family protein [Geobacteraceae bacterium]
MKKLKNRMAGGLLPKVVYCLVRALYATMRTRVVGGENIQPFHDRGEGVIYIFWHARLLMAPMCYTGKEVYVLISSHGDGEIIANVMRLFRFHLVRGSSSKGGREAFHDMVRLARNDKDLAITPDGPRGPAEVVKHGVANLARLTGKAVIPVSFGASRAKRFSSWDRFMVPYPFSRGVYVMGEPLYYNKGENTEAFRLRIEEALKAATWRADELAGQ